MIATKPEQFTPTEAAALAELSEQQIRRFFDWKQHLRSTPAVMGGAVTFANSRLTVRHIGTMLERGVDPAEIVEDYPYLTRQDLEFAHLFVQAYPLTDSGST